MQSPAVRRVTTDDGSSTLVRADTGWTYRSTFGAVEEARTVFIEGGALLDVPGVPRVLEFGFGAAINFAQTWEALAEAGRDALEYCALDAAPVSAQDLRTLGGRAHDLAAQATDAGHARHGKVHLEVQRVAFEAFDDPRRFDLLYFDPFGPSVQPQSWSEEVFRVAWRHAQHEARLVTYSAAGWVRRNMARAGFYVATVPGSGRKREFTVASRCIERLAPWRVRNRPEAP